MYGTGGRDANGVLRKTLLQDFWCSFVMNVKCAHVLMYQGGILKENVCNNTWRLV